MTNKPLTTLEQITLAASWGWSAVIDKSYYVVAISKEFEHIIVCFIGSKRPSTLLFEDFYGNTLKDKITGYLYMGELGGSEPIPEGQKFRVKRKDVSEMIVTSTGEQEAGWSPTVSVYTIDDEALTFYRDEIEPYFN